MNSQCCVKLNLSIMDTNNTKDTSLSSTSSTTSLNEHYITSASSSSSSSIHDSDENELNKLDQLEMDLKEIKTKLVKLESEIIKEKNKLATSNLSIQRHGVNLFEWENIMKIKLNQLNMFVQNFKLNVFYSNDSQLNKLLFKNNYFADLNTEIFDLQEKINYLYNGVIRQLQSGISDSQLRIDELKKNQETLRIKHSHLQNQYNRQTYKLNKIK